VTKVNPLGIDVEIASQQECEQASAVVCAVLTTPLYFPDNLTGPCADCGDMLQWRPHAPKAPPKLCMRCALCRVHAQGPVGGTA
jgi:hypothetical protein